MDKCNGIVYKITDIETGQFYIGETKKDKWYNGYMGSGNHWLNHIRKYPNHKYKREILHNNISSYEELFDLEILEIRKYCKYDNVKRKWVKITDLLLNEKLYKQSDFTYCPECGAYNNVHKKTCSRYYENLCLECGGYYNHHKVNCSQFILEKCEFCGSTTKHKNWCPNNTNEDVVCGECKVVGGNHLKSCSKYKDKLSCKECGSKSQHKLWCSKKKSIKIICDECGGKQGIHKKTCSLYKPKKKCIECGNSLTQHKVTCSLYKKKKQNMCNECGSPNNSHKSYCSKSYHCPECGSTRKHKQWCSKAR